MQYNLPLPRFHGFTAKEAGQHLLPMMNHSKILSATILTIASSLTASAQPEAATSPSNTYEGQYTRPLGDVLEEIAGRFDVRFRYAIDTVGLTLPYADFRIRPYSLEESLDNVLKPFDFTYEPQKGKYFKIRRFDYPRRIPADGEKLIAWLNSLYPDREAWEARRDTLKCEVRERLGVDKILEECIGGKPVMGKVRSFDGYKVQNFYLETLPGLYVAGSIYSPAKTRKGSQPLIICPNGHFANGRYNDAQQLRMATLARMGAVCVDYDLYGWGESELQVGLDAHRTPFAHAMQIANGLLITDFMLRRPEIDHSRVGVNGGSGGGSQVVLLALLDDRFTASCPTVSLASHFDGGCPCESGLPIHLAAGGSCNPEFAATFAPRPMCVVSDGGDWTRTMPTLEYPYLQRIYGFYDAQRNLSNPHFPDERHDFGPSKRNAVYDFFIDVFSLDSTKRDESKVTIEPADALKSFGADGALLPKGARRFEPGAGK